MKDIKKTILKEIKKLHKKEKLIQEKRELLKKIYLLEDNIFTSYRNGHLTIQHPIIPDAIKVISNNKEAIEFHNKSDFEDTLKKQHYFSASYSHCYDSLEDFENSKPNDDSVLLFETGHKIVAVWDDKNQIGYIIPKNPDN